jgi:hypothetical protein
MVKFGRKSSIPHKNIHSGMVATLGNDDPSYAIEIRWVAKFKHDNQRLEYDPNNSQ